MFGRKESEAGGRGQEHVQHSQYEVDFVRAGIETPNHGRIAMGSISSADCLLCSGWAPALAVEKPCHGLSSQDDCKQLSLRASEAQSGEDASECAGPRAGK